MPWTRRPLAALAVCALLLFWSAGCGTSDAGERTHGRSPAPVGRLLDVTDDAGRPYREVDAEHAPEVDIEIQPDTSGAGWDVRLSVHGFGFSPAGARAEAVSGRGFARLFVDGRPVAELRSGEHRLDAGLVPRGTHQVTARLYADDGTGWAVDGEPVQCTADITASGAEPTAAATGPGGTPDDDGRAS
ncbi:hypothetical protein ADL00_11975 [Streptomyces sp. AS58]|uniref:Nuclear transport factor 2 family protein n=1 Tax=Streptomyces cadmiisoli TaxID=2184053 RepID=A0A2Z4J5Z4_9ACTN|nr:MULTISPECIES: hypothetical protein [Streptomyces]AWW40396.1 hypothetical protein DN051_30055 [Streptomyces cadmiisoli]KOV68941.1 hypothetical protein ADL00_11975 [Streptomyces sp. AS58]